MQNYLTWASVHAFLERFPGAEFDPGGKVFPDGVVRVRRSAVAYPAGGARGSPPDARPGEEFVFVRLPPSERAALVHEMPETFFVTPHYETAPGVIVRLSAVDPTHLEELLTEAWRVAAPKRLVKEYDERGNTTNGDPS